MTKDQSASDRLALAPRDDADLRMALRAAARTPQQALMAPIHAIARQLHEVLWRVQDRAVAAQTLAWWQTEIRAMERQQATHPLTRHLQPKVADGTLPTEYFEELVDARLGLLEQPVLDTPQAHALYCYRAGSALLLLDGAACGYGARATHRALTRLGHALEELRILHELRPDLDHGLCLLPPEEIARAGLRLQDLLAPVPPDTVHDLFRAMGERIWREITGALDEIADEDRAALLPVRVYAGLRRHLLELLDEEGYPVLRRRIEIAPLRRWWLARRLRRQLSHSTNAQ